MNPKIVIIEDDPFTKQLYSHLMKKAGFEAFILEDANLLIEKLDTEDIRLIIMDINLRNTYLNENRIDGIQLSKFIKSQEKYSAVPVILVSAYSFSFNMDDILKESLAYNYITKPITDFNAFINTIRQAITN